MKKLFFLLACCLVFIGLLCPAVSYGTEAGATHVFINGEELGQGEYWFNDGTTDSQARSDGMGYVRFIDESNMSQLTMHNAHIVVNNGVKGVVANGSLRISPDEGTLNTIESRNANAIEIGNGGRLNISGRGDLSIDTYCPDTSLNAAISCSGLSAFDFTGELYISARGQGSMYGIRSANGAVSFDACKATIEAVSMGRDAFGIFCASNTSALGDNLELSLSDITVNARAGSGTGYALAANNLSVIVNEKPLTITGSTAAMHVSDKTFDAGADYLNIRAGDTAPGNPYNDIDSVSSKKFIAVHRDKTTVNAVAHYGGSVAASADGLTFTFTPDAGYVVDEVFIDGVEQTPSNAQRSSYAHTFTRDDQVHIISVSFAYAVNFNTPANGTLTVSRAGIALSSGDIVHGGDILSISGVPAQAGNVMTMSINDEAAYPFNNRYEYVVGSSGSTRTVGSNKVMGQGTVIAAAFAAAPTDKLNPPASPVWNSYTAQWQAVQGSTAYAVQLYRADTSGILPVGDRVRTTGTSLNLATKIAGNGRGEYFFDVIAVGNGITKADSEPSEKSGLLAYPPVQYRIILSHTENYFFTDKAVDAEILPEDELTVTVYNIGTQATGALQVSLTNDIGFALSKTSLDSIPSGGFATFVLSPRSHIIAATYVTMVHVGPAATNTNALSSVFFTIRLHVTGTNTVPGITGDTSLTVREGYADTVYSTPYTITGAPLPTVSFIQGNPHVFWDNTNNRLMVTPGLAKGSYTVELRVSNTVSPDAQLEVDIVVEESQELLITNGGEDAHVVVGQPATFAVQAQGKSLSYQWYVDRKDGRGFVQLPGEEGPSYTTQALTLSHNGYRYFCRVSNWYGNWRDSRPCTLYVTESPVLPDTGDKSKPILWIALAVLCGAGPFLMIKAQKKKKSI